MLKGEIIEKSGFLQSYIVDGYDYMAFLRQINVNELNKEFEDDPFTVYIDSDQNYNLFVSEDSFDDEEELQEILNDASGRIKEFGKKQKYVFRILNHLSTKKDDLFHVIDILLYTEGIEVLLEFIKLHASEDMEYRIYKALGKVKLYRDPSIYFVPSHA